VRALRVETLSVRCFRNISAADIVFGAGFNVVSGDNGQGKTNLVEAVYALATSKSFRVTKPGELVQHGQDVASLRAEIEEDGDRREQTVGFREGGRLAKIDGKRPQALTAYAVRTPAVVFHPGEISLSMGGGSERRKLLDRISLYVSPAASSELERYTRALRERQKALEMRGPGARDAPEWEELMVRHGVVVREARAEASRRLAEGARNAFQRIAAPETVLDVSYAPGSPKEPEAFRDALAKSRVADAHRGSASVGPHRDDLALRLDGQAVRGFASQGQHRTMVLSLKSAEVDVVAQATGLRPLLLLDDVSSELDRSRTAALFEHLQGHEGQVFLTTTRPELIEISGPAGDSRRDFSVRAGVVRREPSAGA
jgi:DNA replication and repair protein RecF